MNTLLKRSTHFCLLLAAAVSCQAPDRNTEDQKVETEPLTRYDSLLNKYTTVRLTADLSGLTDRQRDMIPLLIEVGEIMDELFWYEAYGARDELLKGLPSESAERFVQINYGPWDRLNNNEPFIEGVGPKPAGANFYPADMTKEEFEASELEDKTSLYTFIRRNDNGDLITVPYHEIFAEQVGRASELLKRAAELADNPELKRYLELRAEALLNDDYRESDLVWMDMKTNQIDIITGLLKHTKTSCLATNPLMRPMC